MAINALKNAVTGSTGKVFLDNKAFFLNTAIIIAGLAMIVFGAYAGNSAILYGGIGTVTGGHFFNIFLL